MDKILYDLYLAASKNSDPSKNCENKVGYKTEELAKRAIRVGHFKKPMSAYPCYHCGEWHIGKTIPMSQLRRMAKFSDFGE